MRVDTIDERLALFRHMMEHAGLTPEEPSLAADELAAAAQRCLGCRVAGECRSWLGDVPPEQPLPGFCRNAEPFRDWVCRQVAAEVAYLDDSIGRLEAARAAEDRDGIAV
ncbi:hypothetical protein FHS55_001763 [Angulomicrobium tetraedrale]|uniref:DUF6455 domain-containing protein n=1 Tax=Ancylobacter tetraedralis TaxID=217068 RepID=A0A839Z382_9HYPH|nr:DUF6455 family protein [Ancylobacter tetraedralis]MBB3771164.1 hypothetical protein [Ancylobacter tetraedralis]